MDDTLTIKIDAGVTKAETVRLAVNTEGTFAAVHAEGDNSGSGEIDPASRRIIGALAMVKDIKEGGLSSEPSEMTGLGNWLYFAADDGVSGVELWRTNGTTTDRIKDIDTHVDDYSVPTGLTVFGSYIYFAADNGSGSGEKGVELWRTNGTTTEIVADINAGTGDSSPHNLYVFNSKLYFAATNGSGNQGVELWRTDGTTTERMSDINTGTADANPGNLVAIGTSKLYFGATDTAGESLYSIDTGTTVTSELGRVVVTRPSDLTSWDGTGLAFVDEVNGQNRVKKLDATTLISTALKDFAETPKNLTVADGKLFFSVKTGVDDRLYISDGTAVNTETYYAGSEVSTDLRYEGSTLNNLTNVNGKLYYIVSGSKNTLYMLDPSGFPTDPVIANIPVTKVKDLSGTPEQLTGVGDVLFFSLDSGRGVELWQSRGAEGNTIKLLEKVTDSPVSNPLALTSYSSKLFFTSGSKLWRSEYDGTAQWLTGNLESFGGSAVSALVIEVLEDEGDGVITLADRASSPAYTFTSKLGDDNIDLTEAVRSFIVAGKTWMTIRISSDSDILLQRAAIGNDDATGMWVTSEERAGVLADLYSESGNLLKQSQSIVDLSQLAGGTYFLRVFDPNRNIDATTVKDIKGNVVSSPANITAVGETVYFTDSSDKLWRTNGSSTIEVKIEGHENQSVTTVGTPANLTAVGEALFFTIGTQLWRTDGIFAVKVSDLTGNASSLTAVNSDRLYFMINNELWLWNGVVSLAKDIGAAASNFTTSGDTLFFTVNNLLWQSSSAGTGLVSSIVTGTEESENMIAMAGDLFYTTWNGTDTVQLWKSLTLESENVEAMLVKSFTATAAIDLIGSVDLNSNSTIYDDLLFFTVPTVTGLELWTSNGAGDTIYGTTGTVKIHGDIGGAADILKIDGTTIYFTVLNAGVYEIWQWDGAMATTSSTATSGGKDGRAAIGSFEVTGDTISFAVSNDGTMTGDGEHFNDMLIEINSVGATPATSYDYSGNKLTIEFVDGITTTDDLINSIKTLTDSTYTFFNVSLNGTKLMSDAESIGNASANGTAAKAAEGSFDVAGDTITFKVSSDGTVNGSGLSFNNMTIELVRDDASPGAGYDAGSNILTIRFAETTTTTADIEGYIEGLTDGATYTFFDASGGNADSRLKTDVVNLTNVSANGTADLAAAGSFELAGDTIIFKVSRNGKLSGTGADGSAFNNMTIDIVDDSLDPGVSYDVDTNTLTIKFINNVTTTSDIVEALNTLTDNATYGFFSASITSGTKLRAADGTSYGAVDEKTTGGEDSVVASGSFVLAGDTITYSVSADGTSNGNGGSYNNINVQLVVGDNGSRAGVDVAYDSVTKTLIIHVMADGSTNTAQVASAINIADYFFAASGGDTSTIAPEAPNRISANIINNPEEMTIVGSTFYFITENGNFPMLWQSDGSAISLVAVLPVGATATELTSFDNKLFFALEESDFTISLWSSAGTEATTAMVKDLMNFDEILNLTAVGDTLFFNVLFDTGEDKDNDGHNEWDYSLWVTDGTRDNTIQAASATAGILPMGYDGNSPSGHIGIGEMLFFQFKNALYRSDGTMAGTVKVKDFTSLDSFVNADGVLFFSGVTSDGTYLWKSTGTSASIPFRLTLKKV
ncbi:hypothetical protein ACFL9U_14000 [Thermodesulfobacteriota bacterium]